MNPLAQIITDLEALRRSIARGDNASDICNGYLCANREALNHYVHQVYLLTKNKREWVVSEFPSIDGSVIVPDFEKLALHPVEMAATAWLGGNRADEDELHMLIRALRVAEIAVPPISGCTIFLSPVSVFLPSR